MSTALFGEGAVWRLSVLQESSDCGCLSVREEEKMGVRGGRAGWSHGSHSGSQTHLMRLGLFPPLWRGRRLPGC